MLAAHTVPMTTSRAAALRLLAAALGGLTGLAVLAAGLASVRLGWSWADALDAFVLTNAVIGLSFGVCGAILAWHRPGNPIGWLFAAGGVLQSTAAAVPPVAQLLEQAGAGPVLVRVLTTMFVYSWPWAIGLCVPVALLLFPDGRPVSPRWRPVIIAVIVTAPLFTLEMAAAPEPVEDGGPIAYLTLPFYDQLQPLWTFAELRTLAAIVLALVALVVRYRRGSEAIRRQLLWLVLAVIVVIAATLPWGLVAGTSMAVLFSIPLIPLAVTVAIVRYRLLDIRLVLSRALAWVLLSLGVVVGYATLVAAARPTRLLLTRPVGIRHGAPGAGRGSGAAPAAAPGRPGDLRRPGQPGSGGLPARRPTGPTAGWRGRRLRAGRRGRHDPAGVAVAVRGSPAGRRGAGRRRLDA